MNYNNIFKEFFELITSDEFLEMSKIDSKSFTRNKNMNFRDIIYFMLSRGKDNTSVELDRYAQNEGIQLVSRQAYCKSRQKIKPSAFKYMSNWLVKKIYSSQIYKTCKNYLILAIDGCLLDMPWVDELKMEYGGKSNKNGEIEAIKAKSSGLYDCDNKIMIDFEVAPYRVSEKELALKNIQNSLEIIKDKNPLIIFDRYYASLELFNYLLKLGFKFLFRLKKNFYKEERSMMKSDDEFIDIKVSNARINHIKDTVIKNELKKKEKFNLRVTRVLLDSGEYEWLISNLRFGEFSNDELKDLYNQRWNIETSFDTLKNALEIERITAKKRLTVEQDFYSQIVNYNLSQDVIKDVESDFDDKKKIL